MTVLNEIILCDGTNTTTESRVVQLDSGVYRIWCHSVTGSHNVRMEMSRDYDPADPTAATWIPMISPLDLIAENSAIESVTGGFFARAVAASGTLTDVSVAFVKSADSKANYISM